MAAHNSLASLRELSKNFDAVSKLLISRSSQMLPQAYNELHAALVAAHQSTSALSEWPSTSQDIKASLAAKLVMQAHRESINAYTAFVQAVLACEHITTPNPGLHNRAHSTRSVSVLLTIPMTIFTDLPSSWPTSRYLLRNPPLYAALNALAAYFLSRKLKTDLAIGAAVSAQHVVTPALLLLHTTSVCLDSLHSTFDSAVLTALPSGFLNKIFCVACEELGPYLSDNNALLATGRHWVELSNLLSLVVYCVHNANGTASFARLCNLLLGPGTLEAGRMLKLAYCSEALQAENKMSLVGKNFQLLLVWCGSQFLLADKHGSAERFLQVLDSSSAAGSRTQHFLQSISNSGNRTLFADASSSSNSGDQITANHASPRIKVTDEHLTFVLCAQSRSDPSTMVENTKMIHLMWMNHITGQSLGSMELPIKLHSAGELLGIANHCTHQVLLWLRDQQCTQAGPRSSQLGDEVTQRSAEAANPLRMTNTTETKHGILELRSLMMCCIKEGKAKEKPGECAVPHLSKLDLRADVRRWVWLSMPGRLVTMEALLRQENCVLTSEQLCYAMMANEPLLLMASPLSLPTYLSLVSTIRKHTAMFAKTAALWGEIKEGTEAEVRNSIEERLKLARCEELLAGWLKSLLFCKDCGGKLGKSENAHRDSGSSQSVTCRNRIHNMYQSPNASSSAALSSSSSPQTSSSLVVASFTALEQLRAIVLVTLTHIHGLTCWDYGGHEMQPIWVTYLLLQVDPYLASVIKPHLFPIGHQPHDCPLMCGGQMDAAIWEQYVMRNFQGRLLAGCCYLGCRNMSGCSEGTLPTLLCGGCRRARYCSTECQRAAWLDGHKCACGGQNGEAKLDSSGKWVVIA